MHSGPAEYARGVKATGSVETPIGALGVEASAAGIRRVRLPGDGELEPRGGWEAETHVAAGAAQIAEYVRGERETFDLELD